MRNPIHVLAEWLDYRSQAIELSIENRQLTAALARANEANDQAARVIMGLQAHRIGDEYRVRERETQLRELEERNSFLETQVAATRRRRDLQVVP